MIGPGDRGGGRDALDREWSATASGLYLPKTSDDAAASSLTHSRWQAWGTVAAAGVAVAALIVSLITAILQFSANSLAQDNDRSEYASKVAWWLESDTLKVQNRSVVPIRALSLSYQVQKKALLGQVVAATEEGLLRIGLTKTFALDTLQPCAILSLPVRNLLNELDATPGFKVVGDGDPRIDDGSLLFTDAHGDWAVAAGGAPVPLSTGQRADMEAEQREAASPPSDAGRSAQPQVGPAPECGS